MHHTSHPHCLCSYPALLLQLLLSLCETPPC
jgi:hypothetical protein